MSKITRKIIAQSGTNLPKEFIEDYFVAGTYQGDGFTGRLIPTDNGDGHVVDLQNSIADPPRAEVAAAADGVHHSQLE